MSDGYFIGAVLGLLVLWGLVLVWSPMRRERRGSLRAEIDKDGVIQPQPGRRK